MAHLLHKINGKQIGQEDKDMILRKDLVRKLNKEGVATACGKPLADATLSELQDEWGRLQLTNGERGEGTKTL